MARRALVDVRPYLLLSVIAALAFYYLRWTSLPGVFLLPIKGAAAGFLAIYAATRHSSADARLLAWGFGFAALGDMAGEVDLQIGALLMFLYMMLTVGVYLQNRRARMTRLHSWICGVTVILTPILAYVLPAGRTVALPVGFYGLSLGAMAASAWASSFPRLRVGAGAMLFLVANLLLIAGMGPLEGSEIPTILAWPTAYLGQLLICIGVIQTLRKRDPELKLVSSR